MLRTVQFACTLPKAEADALNAESGRIYTDMLVSHYRIYRRQGHWLKAEHGERWEDAHGGPTTLHAHSRDAAQQGFYAACKTARACKQAGLDTKYPYHRKRWRTTIWKRSGIRLQAGIVLLARQGASACLGGAAAPVRPIASRHLCGGAAGLGPRRSALRLAYRPRGRCATGPSPGRRPHGSHRPRRDPPRCRHRRD